MRYEKLLQMQMPDVVGCLETSILIHKYGSSSLWCSIACLPRSTFARAVLHSGIRTNKATRWKLLSATSTAPARGRVRTERARSPALFRSKFLKLEPVAGVFGQRYPSVKAKFSAFILGNASFHHSVAFDAIDRFLRVACFVGR